MYVCMYVCTYIYIYIYIYRYVYVYVDGIPEGWSGYVGQSVTFTVGLVVCLLGWFVSQSGQSGQFSQSDT